MKQLDTAKIETGVRLILEGIGEDPNSARLRGTPARAAAMFAEVLASTGQDPRDFLKTLTEEEHDEMVILKDIPIYSLCEHHLLPFSGKANIAYIPKKGRIIGLNTLGYLVDFLAKRLQLQERLTKQIADYLFQALDPLGVMVVIKAEHLCMTMRGVKKPGSMTITSAVRGVFRENLGPRQEAMSLLMAPENR